jgi:hypothetical protein
MTDTGESTQRASIASVDARVRGLEVAQAELAQKQVEQDGVMRLIQLEQQHIREIMTARFVGLEGLLQSQGSKLDNFIGKIEVMIADGQRQSTELGASPLGRQVDERLKRAEQWVEISKEFHAEQRGQRKLITALVGGNVLAAVAALFAIARTLGWL